MEKYGNKNKTCFEQFINKKLLSENKEKNN